MPCIVLLLFNVCCTVGWINWLTDWYYMCWVRPFLSLMNIERRISLHRLIPLCDVLCLVSNRMVPLRLCRADASTTWQVVLSTVSRFDETTRPQVTACWSLSTFTKIDQHSLLLCGAVWSALSRFSYKGFHLNFAKIQFANFRHKALMSLSSETPLWSQSVTKLSCYCIPRAALSYSSLHVSTSSSWSCCNVI